MSLPPWQNVTVILHRSSDQHVVILGMMLPIIIVCWLSVMKSEAAGSGDIADVASVLMSPTMVASLLVPDIGSTVI